MVQHQQERIPRPTVSESIMEGTIIVRNIIVLYYVLIVVY